MEASKPNPVLNNIGVNSLWLRGVQIINDTSNLILVSFALGNLINNLVNYDQIIVTPLKIIFFSQLIELIFNYTRLR